MSNNRERLFAASHVVEAGDWRAELRNDELAEISYAGIPVLRGIRAVVRDRDWQTLVPVVRAVEHVQGVGHRSVLIDVDFNGFGCRYAATLKVSFSGQCLDVEFDGEAPADFESNRIGLVVLHGPDDAGRSVLIGGADGSQKASQFPVDISPHQPFQKIATMQWQRDGTDFRLAFAGDVFETEDQRNWTDASFKTYSRPLALPFPMNITAGSRVSQTITLTASATAREPQPGDPAVEELAISADVESVVPALSVPVTPTTRTESPPALFPGLESLLVELVAGAPNMAELAGYAAEHAEALGVPLDVRLSAETPDQMPALLKLVPPEDVARLSVFNSTSHVTEPDLWKALKFAADEAGFTASLIAGARSHFAELNRNADILPVDAESVTYSITPQMHVTEVPHMVDSLPMQRLTARNALRISGGRPIHVGPVTLKPRFNAVATSTGAEEGSSEAPVDPLQLDPFAAAWVLGSIAALSIPGVQSISYFEAEGPRGISTPTGLTPAGKVLASIAALRGHSILKYRGTRPGLVLYPVQARDGIVLHAANLTTEPMVETVRLPDSSITNLVLEPWSAIIQHIKTEGRTT